MKKEFFNACQHDCPDNCAMISTVEDGKVISVKGRKDHPFTRGVLCSKVKSYHKRIYSDQRIFYPLRRIGEKGEGKFQRISWKEALYEIKSQFTKIIKKNGAESILPCSYLGHQGLLNGLHCGDSFFNKLGATIGERTFCNASASKAFRMVAGPVGGIDPESFAFSKIIIIWGMNILSTSMHHARFIIKAINNGAKFIVIDPIISKTAKKADLHIQPFPGTDVALALGLISEIVKRNLHDTEYINKYTKGFKKLLQRANYFDLKRTSQITGVPQKTIKYLANMIGNEKSTAIRLGVAIERNKNGADAVRAITSLATIIGAWNEKGGGVFQHPHGNLPINREKITTPELGKKNRNSTNLFGLADALDDNAKVKILSLFIYNSNPVIAVANQNKLIKNLRRENLFTVVSEIFHTDTCDYADIILPATSQLEQYDLMYSWGHFNLQYNDKSIEPLGEAVSNTELFRRMAKVMNFKEEKFTFNEENLIKLSLNWNSPSMQKINFKKIKENGFVRLNVGSADERIPHKNGNFKTPSKKFEFFSSVYKDGGSILDAYTQGNVLVKDEEVDPLPNYIPSKIKNDEFVLLSPKSHMFLNSGYANLNNNKEIANKQRIYINENDAQKYSISNEDEVEIWNEKGKIFAYAKITNEIIEGVVLINHGFWMKHIGGGTVNMLVSNIPGKIGQGITVNDTKVRIKRKIC